MFSSSTEKEGVIKLIIADDHNLFRKGVSLNANIAVSFSENIDSSSLNSSTFVLKEKGGSIITATITYGSSLYQAILDPQDFLKANKTYVVELNGIKDLAGNEITSFSWSFSKRNRLFIERGLDELLLVLG